MTFIYPLIYLKNDFANCLSAKKAPVSYFEDISVFVKDYDTQCLHPLREYFSEVLMFIGKTRTETNKELGDRTAEHCFYVEAKKAVKNEIGGAADHTFRNGSSQFSLCTEATYNKLIALFGIDKMQGYKSYNELQEINRTFNIPKGKNHFGNVLNFGRDKETLHPTQKPVALIQRLIEVYTNEGDTVLDNCMGSGTTAIAAIRAKRNFIGFELMPEYYDKANKRIEIERQQYKLF